MFNTNRLHVVIMFQTVFMLGFFQWGFTTIEDQFFSAVTVGKNNCDFTSISEALKNAHTDGGLDIVMMDHVHTENAIVVNKKVRILSGVSGQAVIQAKEKGKTAKERVFFISEEGDVQMENLIIRYGIAESYYGSGGGIHNRGKITLINCEISENISHQGGGIWNNGVLIMNHCFIKNNKTISPSSMELFEARGCRGAGGGLKNEKPGFAWLTDCVVSDNSAASRGGGIFVACESTLKVLKTQIETNSSTRSGGGLHNRGTVTLETCIIQNNYSRKKGKGITNLGVLSVTGTTVAGNKGNCDCYLDKGAGYHGKGSLKININSDLGLGNCM